MRDLKRLSTPEGLFAGQTATQRVDIGPSYHRFNLNAHYMNAGVKTPIGIDDWGDHIGDMRLVVDGVTIQEFDAAWYISFLKYNRFELSAGMFPILQSLPWARLPSGEDATILGTYDLGTVNLQFDIKEGSTITGVNTYAEQAISRNFGAHVRMQRFSSSMGASGEKEVSDMPRGPWNMLGIHINTGNIDKAVVEGDGYSFHDSTRIVRGAILKAQGKSPQNGHTHLDFMPENRITETLPMATFQDFRLKLGFTSETPNFDMYAVSVRGTA